MVFSVLAYKLDNLDIYNRYDQLCRQFEFKTEKTWRIEQNVDKIWIIIF